MIVFDNYIKARKFSKENTGTLVRYTGGIVKCYLYNGMFHGEYVEYNNDSSVNYLDFNTNGLAIDHSSLSDIQLHSIFGECYNSPKPTITPNMDSLNGLSQF